MAAISTISQASSILNAVKIRFRDPQIEDIITAGCNRVDLYAISDRDSEPHLSFITSSVFFEQIVQLSVLKQGDGQPELLLLCTARCGVFVLGWKEGSFENLVVIAPNPSKCSDFELSAAFVASDSGSVVLIYKNGVFAVVTLKPARSRESRHAKLSARILSTSINASFVSSVVQIDKIGNSTGRTGITQRIEQALDTFAILYDNEFLEFFEYDKHSRDVRSLGRRSVVPQIEGIITGVHCGAGGLLLVFTYESVRLLGSSGEQIAQLKTNSCPCQCCCQLDETSWLLGDNTGNLCRLSFDQNNRELKLATVCIKSSPACILQLAHSTAFVGSRLGDSFLINIETGTVIEEITNLASIIDLEFQKDEAGYNKILCCTRDPNDGWLRRFQYGVGIRDSFFISELGSGSMIVSLFGFQLNVFDSDQQQWRLCSVLSVSRSHSSNMFLAIGQEITDIADMLPALSVDQETLYIGIFDGNCVVQVTTAAMIITSDARNVVQSVSMDIRAAARAADLLLLATGSRQLLLIRVKDHKYEKVAEYSTEDDISCIAACDDLNLFAVGLFNARILCLDSSLSKLFSERFEDGLSIPRSLAICIVKSARHCDLGSGLNTALKDDYSNDRTFDVLHVFVAFANGKSEDVQIDTGLWTKLSRNTIIEDSARPARLVCAHGRKDQSFVAVCSDRLQILHESRGQFICSNANLQNVYHCASIAANDIEGVPAANAFAIEDGILIGKLSVESQLLVETHKLSEPPREIVFDPEHSLYYVLTEVDDSADSYSTSLLAIDAQSLKQVSSVRFDKEYGFGLAINRGLIAVGCEITKYAERPPSSKVSVFKFDVEQCEFVRESDRHCAGELHCLAFKEDLIWIAINSEIEVVRYQKRGGLTAWTDLAKFGCPTLAVEITPISGNRVIVRDFMFSFFIVEYNDGKGIQLLAAERSQESVRVARPFKDVKSMLDSTSKSDSTSNVKKSAGNGDIIDQVGLDELIAVADDCTLSIARFVPEDSNLQWLYRARPNDGVNAIQIQSADDSELFARRAVCATMNGAILAIGCFRTKRTYELLLELQKVIAAQFKVANGFRLPHNQDAVAGSAAAPFIDADLLLDVCTEHPQAINKIIAQSEQLKSHGHQVKNALLALKRELQQ